MHLRRVLLPLTAVLCLAACGKKEADQMTKYADEMCACKDTRCAEAIFPKIEKFTKDNEGKEVEASAADHYNRELDRTQKCYDKLMAASE